MSTTIAPACQALAACLITCMKLVWRLRMSSSQSNNLEIGVGTPGSQDLLAFTLSGRTKAEVIARMCWTNSRSVCSSS